MRVYRPDCRSIVSTTQARYGHKLNPYMKSGVLEYWIADLENKSILQYSFSHERDIESLITLGEEDTIKSTVFEGLEVPLRDIFM